MTRDEIVDQIWVATGKATDLDPTTDISWGGGPYLYFVANEAQRQVAKWRNRETGRPIRIYSLLDSFTYWSYTTTDTLAAVNNSDEPPTIQLTSAGLNNDRYNDWMVEITSGSADGQTAIITDYDGSTRTATLHEAFSTDPAVGDTVKLYKRFERILPSTHAWAGDHMTLPIVSDMSLNSGNLLEILSIVNMKDETELSVVDKTEKFVSSITRVGTPVSWYRFGDTLYYDCNVDEKIPFRVEYYRSPTNMSEGTDTPDIPELWHMAMVIWGIHMIHVRKMESGLAYARKMDFEDEMRRTYSEYDMRKERISLKGEVQYED